MKTGFLITARLKSTRLEKKIMLKVEGKEILRWMIDRIKLSKNISKIILCTSTSAQDDPLEQIAEEENIDYYRGSEEDVIERLYMASAKFNLDYCLNLTADCPLVSLECIDDIINEYKKSNADFIQAPSLPHGFFSWGLKPSALKKVCEIKNDKNTEVWGKYFTETGLFKVVNLPENKKLTRESYRLTIDYPEDFNLFQKIFSFYGKNTYKISMYDLIAFLDNNPEIANINKHCKMKYDKRWNSQSKISLK